MYLDDQYTTPTTQVKSIDISQYSQNFSQYNQQTKFTIIEDFQKDILIIVFTDNVFFIQISQTQIIHYLNFQENLSQSQADGQIRSISLDKQSNILTCITQENIIIYDYSSITFYDYQNFYLGPQNADLISYIAQTSNQNDNLIVFAREFNYNLISFYQVSLQKQTMTPFLSLDVTQDQDLQFTLKGGPLGRILNINDGIKYNYRIIQILKQTTNDLSQYIIIQHHILRYCVYQLNNSNINLIKIYYFQSINYQYYTLLEELNFFPILLLQSTIASTIYLQIIDNESNIISLVSSQFYQLINDCNIRNQTIYCFDQQGMNLITINIQDPNNFKFTQISQLDQQLTNQNIIFGKNIIQNTTNLPLVFYCSSIVFSWNPILNKLSKLQMANNIQSLKVGSQYILLELYQTFDLKLVAIDQDGMLVNSLYNLKQPAQKLRDLSSSSQIPLFYNKKYEESKITEQISQFLVLQTFGQANIYSLIDFSLYLTIRSFNITAIQQIQILSKQIMLLASKAEIDVYYFSKNNYNLLQSFQVSLPIIGYAILNTVQQLNTYQLSMVISSNYDIRLLQYTLTTNQNVDSSIYASDQQCVLKFSDYIQDLSLLQYSVKMQAIQDQFVSKNYANIQVLEIYFIPQTSLYLRQDIFQTLKSSNFTLRLYSDQQNSLVYLINQNYNNINNIFNASIANLEILNMRLTIPQQPQNKQLITPIVIDINSSQNILSISLANTIIDLDSQVCIIYQNMNELIFSNSDFITSQHLINSSAQNSCMILIKNINFVYLDRLTFKNFTTQNKYPYLKYLIAFDSIQTLSISNIVIQNSNLQVSSIFNFQNIGNLTINNILVNTTKSSGSIISSSNINNFFIQSLQIYNSQFEGKSYSLIQIMGSLINNLQNLTVTNSTGPSFVQVQEQFYNKVIIIVSQVTVSKLQVIDSEFKDQQNPSIYISSLNINVEIMSIQNGIFNSDIIQFYSNIIKVQNLIVNKNQIYGSLFLLNSFQHKNLGSELDALSCQIQHSQFNDNSLQNGQVIYIFQHSKVILSDLIINMNYLEETFYGTVSFDTTNNIIINNTLISKNNVQKGCGGGIYISNSQVYLNNCTISFNYAVIGGGIRYQGMNSSLIYRDNKYKYRHLDIQQSQIFNNKALLFGQQITSYPKSIKFQMNYTQMLSQLVSGNTLSQPLIFYLVDEFEEVVNYPLNIETNKIHEYIIKEFQGYDILIVNQDESKMHIQGGIQIYNNYITFQPQITSNPSSTQFLQIQLSSKVPIYDFQQNYFILSSVESNIQLNFLPCQVGQIPKQEFNLIQCYECPQGKNNICQKFFLKSNNNYMLHFKNHFLQDRLHKHLKRLKLQKQIKKIFQDFQYYKKKQERILLQAAFLIHRLINAAVVLNKLVIVKKIQQFYKMDTGDQIHSRARYLHVLILLTAYKHKISRIITFLPKCIKVNAQNLIILNYNNFIIEQFEKSICRVGHIGALCESCDINNQLWGDQYSKSDNLSCMKCKDNDIDIISYFLLYLAMLCYLSFCFRKIQRFTTQKCLFLYIKRLNFICIGKSSESDQNTVATKILINYAQIITIIFQFTNFSYYIKQVIGIFGDSSSDSMQFIFFRNSSKLQIKNFQNLLYFWNQNKKINFFYPFQKINIIILIQRMSIDCILINSLEIGNILTRRSILRILIPLTFLFIFALGIFLLKCKFNYYRLYIYDIKCSFIFLWLFFSPSLINYFVQQLSCVQIGDYSYVLTDKQYFCFGDDHQQNIFFILIPSLVLLYLLLPLFFLFKLKQKRTSLTKIENIKVYGILFYEYRQEKYYWEIIKTTQKSLIYLCTFFDNIGYKAIVSLSVLFIYGLASFFSKPYSNIQLNNLDLMASVLQFNSIVLAIIINLMGNTVWESIFTIIIFFFNFLFIVRILLKVILREIPLDPQQRNLFHLLLIKIKNVFPKFLTSQIIIQSSNQLQVMKRWSKLQKEVFKYIKLKKRNSSKQRNNDQADEIIEEQEQNKNLIIQMNQQTSLYGLSSSFQKCQNISEINLQSKISRRKSSERNNLKIEKFQLIKTDDEFINYFDENSIARSPMSLFTKRQSKNINVFESQQTQDN
ncbi:dienelactone hydrolase family protein (macronuclear) [Tetrahymena thermophila SB210]|uniref:Dienelactone hydrolase family protein n=1 Tax=Tetrahymena thermophila (strain SB210) TaxID=312017 RepID=I7MAE3_TETTS|nr:dienelactone hydrolase family protein [Tetrahymena thermophila SB210]EAS04419.3 dienelactone hydrolase family protein [Tetrahymena thermophila SB210]|eukprot:XP_001024664.3 dienelactone hydrolase family protein [Tetrahymena thermophila SB210]